MKLVIPCRPINHVTPRDKVHAVVVELTVNKINLLLEKMEVIQKMHTNETFVEGLVLASMGAEFIQNEACSQMTLVEEGEPEGRRVLAHSMNVVVPPGWLHFYGSPEFSDVFYESISVHQHLLEGVKRKF